jgi:hypothetical protein
MSTAKIKPSDAAQAAVKGRSFQLQQLLENNEARISSLETKTGALLSTPPQAAVSVSAVTGSGRFVIRITNPEYVNRGNLPKTPLLHLVEFSTRPDFASGMIAFPISTQTYYTVPVEDVGGKVGSPQTGYFRVQSSFDGENFNPPIRSGVVTA